MTTIEHLIESVDGFKVSIDNSGSVNVVIRMDDGYFNKLTKFTKEYFNDILINIIYNRLSTDLLNSLIRPFINEPDNDIFIKKYENTLNSYLKDYISKGGLDLKEELYLKFRLNKKFMLSRYGLK